MENLYIGFLKVLSEIYFYYILFDHLKVLPQPALPQNKQINK